MTIHNYTPDSRSNSIKSRLRAMKWYACRHLICMFIITICSVSSDNVVDNMFFLNVSTSNQWKYIGPGACSVLGIEGKHGPNLIHPRLDLDHCVKYGDKAGVNAVTMYGDGFCMVSFFFPP